MADQLISSKTRRSILQDVLQDNLADTSGKRPAGPPASRKKGRRFGWASILVFLALGAIPVYFFAYGPAQAQRLDSSVRTVYTGKIAPSRAIIAALQQMPSPEPEENLPRNYGALATADIPLAELFGLGVKTIVIDPGHGGIDPGAIGSGGLMEKEVTLDVALRLRERLQKYPGYRILLTRDRDVKVSLRDRVRFANDNRADLFLAIHLNSLEGSRMNVIETYYFGAEAADEDALRLAAAENQGSEYLMAEFRGMIQKIGDTFKQQESHALATYIQESIFRQVRRENESIKNRGTKKAPFIVLLGPEMPSVLAEITCLSNPEEEKKLAAPERREDFARYLEGGIVTYLNRSHPQKSPDGGMKTYAGEKTNGKG